MKYDIPDNQNEILPNIPGYTTASEIAIAEFEGFLKAEILLTEKLTARTKFDCAYILRIHKLALGHIYSFAGKLRDVNISKGGFPFPASRYLPQTMKTFETEMLSNMPNKYKEVEQLIKDVACVHGELLFIHPFREGNGRTARILANLMCRKQGFEALKFDLIGSEEFTEYVSAIQLVKNRDYSAIERIIRAVFPG